VRQADAVRLRHQAKGRAVAVEGAGSTSLHDLETRLVVAEHDLLGDLAVRRLEGQLDGVVAEPGGRDDAGGGVRQQPAEDDARRERFERGVPPLLLPHQWPLGGPAPFYGRPPGPRDGANVPRGRATSVVTPPPGGPATGQA